MKINAEMLTEFVNLLNLSGDVEIRECLISGTKDGLSVYAASPSKTVIVSGFIKGDWSELGDIGIDSVILLKKLLSTCTGDIELTKTSNKLKVTAGKKMKAELVLRNPTYIVNGVPKDKFDILYTKATGNKFTLTQDIVKELSKFYNILGKDLYISGEGKEVAFYMEADENTVDVQFDVAETLAKFEVRIAPLLMKIFPGIKSDKSSMSINDNASVIAVETETDDYKFVYLVAPMVR
jgi:hypothetical protein